MPLLEFQSLVVAIRSGRGPKRATCFAPGHDEKVAPESGTGRRPKWQPTYE
jgi:hypothetical protein